MSAIASYMCAFIECLMENQKRRALSATEAEARTGEKVLPAEVALADKSKWFDAETLNCC